jgi:short-subunit dehydrogenase
MVLGRIERNGWFSQKLALSPEEVADEAVTGMFKGRRVIMPGKFTNLFFRIGLFVPEGIMMLVLRRIFKNYKVEN